MGLGQFTECVIDRQGRHEEQGTGGPGSWHKEGGRGSVLPALGSCCLLLSAYCLLAAWREKPAVTLQRAGLKAAATSVHPAAAHAATMTTTGHRLFFLLRHFTNQCFGCEHE